jgi:signal transduction histidine kinase
MRLWWAGLVAGLLLCAGYAALPAADVALRELGVYTLAELGAIVGVVVGVRRYRPAAPSAWLLIAGALSAYMLGDVLWSVYELMGRDPFPSLADVFYLAGYPLFAAGLVVATRWRIPHADRRVLIDAAMVTVGAGLLGWVFIAQPYAADADLGTVETVVSIAYPLGDLLLVAVAARFLLGAEWRAVALRLLVGGLLLLLVADVLFALDVLTPAQESARLIDTMLLLAVVLIGLAGLHPSMRALTEEAGESGARIGVGRLVLVAGVCLVPPIVLIVQDVRGEPLFLPVTVGAMVVLLGLVVARFADITARAHRAADHESVLSRYAAELLRASGRDELFAVATRAASELIGDRQVRLVAQPRAALGGADPLFSAPVEVRGETVAQLVAFAAPAQLRWVRDSLMTVAAQLSLALERERLLAIEREAAGALSVQNERLRELDRMKDQFVSSVSHELRTPLTSISGYLELILDGEAGELTREQRRFLAIVSRNCDRLNRLVDDILFVARVDAGQLSLQRECVDVAELARRAEESARAAAERRGVRLRLTADDDIPPLWADPTRLAQMLDNLLSNAVKFTPVGGTVTVSVVRRGGAVCLRVSDTGVGIPGDEAARLFERFFRASTAASTQGTGLGLSIVKSIVELHGGAISVESEPGVGTTFLVELPVPDSPIGAAAAASAELAQ